MKRTHALFALRMMVVMFMLFMVAVPALAQDSVPVVPVVDPITPAYEGFLTQLLALLTDATYIPALASGVLIFTNAFKFVFALFKVEISGGRAVVLALAVQVAVWVVYQFAVKGGVDLQFKQWYDAAATIISTLLPLALTLFASHVAYTKSEGNPVLGYKGYRAAKVSLVHD